MGWGNGPMATKDVCGSATGFKATTYLSLYSVRKWHCSLYILIQLDLSRACPHTCRLCSLVVYSIDKHPLSLAEEMLELTRLIILKSPIKR